MTSESNDGNAPDTIAGQKAETQTDIQFDFDLEDIIAGNMPGSATGRGIAAIVEAGQTLPTEGKIEAALLPLYETLLTEIFRQEGGSGLPPMPNRHNVRQHAVKVIQARKVKRLATARASKPGRPQPTNANYTPWPQLLMIGSLLVVIAAVLYFRT